MTTDEGVSGAERRLYLAEVRTLLAEKRTFLAELSFSFLLVTLPLTIHTGLMVFAGRHAIFERLHVMVPFWGFLIAMMLLGLWFAVHALRGLRRVGVELRRLGGAHATVGGSNGG